MSEPMRGEYLQLEAHVDERDATIESLRQQVRQLRQDVTAAAGAAARAKRENGRAIAALREQLAPLYRALQQVFGEMETADVDGVSASGERNPVWDVWKQKIGGTGAKIIDALLTHGALNTQQLAIATGLHRTTIPRGIYDLNQAGLINKNSGVFSLKEL